MWSSIPNELLDTIVNKLSNKDIFEWGLAFPELVERSESMYNAFVLHQQELKKDYGLFRFFNQKMFDILLLYTSNASLHLLDLAYPKLKSKHTDLAFRVGDYRMRNRYQCNICYARTNSLDSHYGEYHRKSIRDVLMEFLAGESF